MPNMKPPGQPEQPRPDPQADEQPGQRGEREAGREAAPSNPQQNPPQQPKQPTDHQGEPKPKARALRGFAAMDAERQRAIASKGGQSQGKANNPGNFANDRQKAREAGRKGGQA